MSQNSAQSNAKHTLQENCFRSKPLPLFSFYLGYVIVDNLKAMRRVSPLECDGLLRSPARAKADRPLRTGQHTCELMQFAESPSGPTMLLWHPLKSGFRQGFSIFSYNVRTRSSNLPGQDLLHSFVTGCSSYHRDALVITELRWRHHQTSSDRPSLGWPNSNDMEHTC